MLDVAFSDSEKGLLKYVSATNNKLNKNESIVTIGMGFDYGDIANEDNRNEDLKFLWQHFSFMGEDDFNKIFECHTNDLELLIDRASKGENICIWKSNNPSSLCGFYYTCHLLKDYACEVSVVEMPEYILLNNQIVSYNSFADVKPEDFHLFLQYEKELSQSLLNYYSDLWQNLIDENSKLRAIINNKLISVPIDFYDTIIKQYIPQDEFIMSKLIGDVLGEANLYISDSIIAIRIKNMIDVGELIVISYEDKENPYGMILKKK